MRCRGVTIPANVSWFVAFLSSLTSSLPQAPVIVWTFPWTAVPHPASRCPQTFPLLTLSCSPAHLSPIPNTRSKRPAYTSVSTFPHQLHIYTTLVSPIIWPNHLLRSYPLFPAWSASLFSTLFIILEFALCLCPQTSVCVWLLAHRFPTSTRLATRLPAWFSLPGIWASPLIFVI